MFTSPIGSANGQEVVRLRTEGNVDINSAGQSVVTPLKVRSVGGAGKAAMNMDNITTTVGASLGTLVNAPAAGPPTAWVPIELNGVVKKFPCW
jgi:hypothetical protein